MLYSEDPPKNSLKGYTKKAYNFRTEKGKNFRDRGSKGRHSPPTLVKEIVPRGEVST
jgi:hypothetical protein